MRAHKRRKTTLTIAAGVLLLILAQPAVYSKLYNLDINALKAHFRQFPIFNESDYRFEENEDPNTGRRTQVVAKGTGSRVRFAIDKRNDNRDVVIKYVHPSHSTERPEFLLNQVINEIETMRLLEKHNVTNVPRLLGTYRTHDDYPVLVTSRDGEETLQEHCNRTHFDDLTTAQIWDILAQLVHLLKNLHDLKICHRWLTLPNITLIGGGVSICLLDLGLAEDLSECSGGWSSCTYGATAVAPPEVLRARANVTKTASSPNHTVNYDVWSLGLQMWMILAGKCRQPLVAPQAEWSRFTNREQRQYVLGCIEKRKPLLDMSGPRFTNVTRSLITRMLECDPRKRPTVNEVIADPYFQNPPANVQTGDVVHPWIKALLAGFQDDPRQPWRHGPSPTRGDGEGEHDALADDRVGRPGGAVAHPSWLQSGGEYRGHLLTNRPADFNVFPTAIIPNEKVGTAAKREKQRRNKIRAKRGKRTHRIPNADRLHKQARRVRVYVRKPNGRYFKARVGFHPRRKIRNTGAVNPKVKIGTVPTSTVDPTKRQGDGYAEAEPGKGWHWKETEYGATHSFRGIGGERFRLKHTAIVDTHKGYQKVASGRTGDPLTNTTGYGRRDPRRFILTDLWQQQHGKTAREMPVEGSKLYMESGLFVWRHGEWNEYSYTF